MINSDSLKWYVFYVTSRHETKIEKYLQKVGYAVFLPMVEEMRQWADRKKKVKVPLFKSYLFVKTEYHFIPFILNTPGIVAAIRFESVYAEISEAEIDSIKRLVSTGMYAEALPGLIKEGNEVIVKEGLLKGQKGRCIIEGTGSYLYIIIEGIFQSIKVKIPKHLLRKL